MKVPAYDKDWSRDPLIFLRYIYEKIASNEGGIKVEIDVLEKIIDKITLVFNRNLSFLISLKIGLDALRCAKIYIHKNLLVKKISSLFTNSNETDPKITLLNKKFNYLYNLTANYITDWKNHAGFQIEKINQEHFTKQGDETSEQIKKLLQNKEFKQDAVALLKSFCLKAGTTVQKFDHFIKIAEKTIKKYFGENFKADEIMPFFEAVYLANSQNTINFILVWDDLKEEMIREANKDNELEMNKKLYWFTTVSAPMMLFVKP